jgi:ribosomal protein S18 acetylase RimI-like enzyme
VADAGPAGLVGFAQLYPVFSSVSAQSAWILNDLFVDSAWRRRGVAAALLTAVLEHGKNTRAAWMSLQTAPDNQAAQALYKRFGFVPDDTYLSFSHSF